MYDADDRAIKPCGAGAVTLLGDNVIHDPYGNWFYVHAPGIDEPLLAIKRNTGDNTVQARLEMVSNGGGQLVAVGDSAGQLNSAYAQQIPGSNGGPWGSGTTTRGQTFNPRRWATPGQSDTISTFRTRQYDPATGVWLQEDPIGLAGGVNLYQYNGNDPNSFSDPFGTCPKDAGGDDKTDLYSDCPVGSSGYHAYLAAQGRGGVINDILGTVAACRESAHCKIAALAGGVVTSVVAGLAATAEVADEGIVLAEENANKIVHLFAKSQHSFDALVEQFGGERAAFRAIQEAAAKTLPAGAVNVSLRRIVVDVAGHEVTVSGELINRVLRIGTAFVTGRQAP